MNSHDDEIQRNDEIKTLDHGHHSINHEYRDGFPNDNANKSPADDLAFRCRRPRPQTTR